jgi:lipopolysaccharide export system permease protein
MSLIGRYIFRQLCQAFLLCLVTLIFIVWLTQALREFDVITAQGQTFATFFTMTVLVLPAFIYVIAPASLFIATLYTLNRLNSDSELVVLSAAGASRWQIVAPFVLLAAIVTLLVGAINISLMPKSLSALRLLVTAARADLISHVIQPGRFSTPDEGMTFHIAARSPQGDLRGLLVDDRRDPNEHITYVAERGRIVTNSEGSYLVMEHGSVQRQQAGRADRIQVVQFDRYLVDVAQLSESKRSVLYKPRERSTRYLLGPNPEDPYYKRFPQRFRAELHERLAGPLLPLVLVFVAIANVGFARTTREGRGFGMAVAICAAVASIIIIFAVQTLALSHGWAIPLLYAVPLAIIALAALLSFGVFGRRHSGALAGYAAFIAAWIGNRAARAGWRWSPP